MQCQSCNTELKTTLEVYGDIGECFCFKCYLSLIDDTNEASPYWYHAQYNYKHTRMEYMEQYSEELDTHAHRS